MKRILASILIASLAFSASAGNMYVYKDKGGQVQLTNVDPSGEKEMGYAEKAYYALSGHTPESKSSVAIDENGQRYLTKVTGTGFFEKLEKEMKAEQDKKDEFERQLAKKPDAAIGMTKSQVRNKTNWGEPKYINTTTNRYGTHEQWVYDDYQYLYFDNGKLTTIQQ